MAEAIAETAEHVVDARESKLDAATPVFANGLVVDEQLAALTLAVQGALSPTFTAPAPDSGDSVMVYGICVCVPSADAPANREVSNLNLLLLTTGDHAINVTDVEGGESAEARRVLHHLLGVLQKALAIQTEEVGGGFEAAREFALEHAGSNGALPHHKLSEREFQVVHMLSKGKTVGGISKELNLSVKTVSTYRVRALKKMNFKTNAELIRYMIQYKLG